MTQRYEPALIKGTLAFNTVLQMAHLKYAIPIQYCDHLELAIAFVKIHPINLAIIHQGMRDNDAVVKAAIHENGRALYYAPEIYKMDREIVRDAIKTHAQAFVWASDELRADREVAFDAVKIMCSMYKYASEVLKADVNFNVGCARLNQDLSLVLQNVAFPGFYDMVRSHIAHTGMTAPCVNCICDCSTMHCTEALNGNHIATCQVGAHMTYGMLATICCTILGVDHVYLVFGTDTICPSMVSRAIVL